MHPNPVFRKSTIEQNLQFARERGFGTLAVNGEAGPTLAHVPFWISPDGSYAEMHLVRSNPIIRGIEGAQKAVLATTGPDGYISPDWYEMDDQVPTWNYVAVHLRGELEVLPATELRGHLDRLSEVNEARLLPKVPWLTSKMPEDALAKMMRMITPCRLTIENVEGTWKLGQNKPEDARKSAAGFVKTYDHGQETTMLAALMTGVQED
ncbi:MULTISPECIES: FMN-binding negative transcriptional regulator [Halocynthiibacter]|uniref:FMN-binding negative transcriptional regulator n=1 Tax=Halocynthiibacter halioticoli TaxID=2986804 RepID=A0AAE3LPA8_9RHOB|nr:MULTISPECIES: FMN-binding negative transcriptional regulator [Halocynthiibacter]MCV6823152.1 FMN-binding negative transcriptional regulator [Halocynthiibacter halioticoli]MCW4056153.1 FMN-binding negative transcriptional regulator [Halocynthiibacter sp. SDUM655004]